MLCVYISALCSSACLLFCLWGYFCVGSCLGSTFTPTPPTPLPLLLWNPLLLDAGPATGKFGGPIVDSTHAAPGAVICPGKRLFFFGGWPYAWLHTSLSAELVTGLTPAQRLRPGSVRMLLLRLLWLRLSFQTTPPPLLSPSPPRCFHDFDCIVANAYCFWREIQPVRRCIGVVADAGLGNGTGVRAGVGRANRRGAEGSLLQSCFETGRVRFPFVCFLACFLISRDDVRVHFPLPFLPMFSVLR